MLRPNEQTRIPGTQLKNRCVTTSTGLEPLDVLLGGGAPNTSIILIDQPHTRQHASVLERYFVAEGLANGHEMFLASSRPKLATDLLENIPEKGVGSVGASSSNSQAEDEAAMKIAWRYSTVPQVESSVGRGKASAKFDLSKKVAVERDEKLQVFQDDPSYATLWQQLHKLLTSERFSMPSGNPKEKNLLRICISDFGSPLWTDVECLKRFILHLRAFTRQAHCVTMLDTDSSVLTDAEYRSVVAQVDAAFRLEVVSESEQEALPSQDRFHGRFHIVKLPTITSVAPPRPECVDLVYVLHRRYLDIKVLHLPPAIGNDEAAKTPCQRAQDQF